MKKQIAALLSILLTLTGCASAGGTAAATAAASAEATAAASASPEATENPDAAAFAADYTQVPADNVFTFRSADEIIQILEHGTGLVFLGFKECPWCQRYAVYLNETAKKAGLTKIYYYDIRQDRTDNTETYQKIVSLLGDNLDFDDEGKPRIYVPDITFVKKGEIIGHDNESSMLTDADGTPDSYWTADRVSALEAKLEPLMEEVAKQMCSECNVG